MREFRYYVRCTATSAIVMLLSLMQGVALAVNLAFMPGDAFFHARLTKATLKEIVDNDTSIKLNYSYPNGSMTFGGYAGFSVLRIDHVSPQLAKNIRSVYDTLREERPVVVQVGRDSKGQPKETELNGFHLFVYNRDVEFERQRIGLKYNQDWMDLPAESLTSKTRTPGFGRIPAIRYVSFIPGKKAVIQDWQFSRIYKPLNVQVPNGIAWGLSGPKITEPLVAQADDLQIVILAESKLVRYYSESNGAEFFSVTNEGCSKFVFDEEELAKSKYP